MGRKDEQLLVFRDYLGRDPYDPNIHASLAFCLRDRDDLDDALAEFRLANVLDGASDPGPFVSSDSSYPDEIRGLELRIAVRSRLPAILQGKDRPKDHEEALECAEVCLKRGLYGISARFYVDALAVDRLDFMTKPRAILNAAGRCCDGWLRTG